MKSQITEAQKAKLAGIMETIIAGLPSGYTATNKQPVKKEIRPLSSPATETLWSSWAKDDAGNRFLALLQNNGCVKLIEQEKLSNFKLRSV